MKFTQEVKDKWIEALKSGNYKRCIGVLETVKNEITKHCCIGVLGDIHPDLTNTFDMNNCNPYTFLSNNIGDTKKEKLWILNDSKSTDDDSYDIVIPFIESLNVIK